MKLYVDITRLRKHPSLSIEIDIESERCQMYLREACPVCNGTGCTPECREVYPAIPADMDGTVLHRIDNENIHKIFDEESLNIIKRILLDNIINL